ncbi:MAG TPA: hypothetical protein P5137_12780 [Candidatus Brocadiia bacterium]|nr:hypothetical protein [Candidatus Brocadiia bacterium]
MLGDLSLVVSRFGKAGRKDNDPSQPRPTYPGDGLYAHREGYNVLRGDGSVRWFGDPQQKIIWTPMPIGAADANTGTQPAGGSNVLYFGGGDYTLSCGIGYFHHFDEGELLWYEGSYVK